MGAPLGKFQRDRAWQSGRLHIEQVHDTELHRWVTVAHLRRADADVFPPLHDVQLVDFKADWFTITGYERLPSGPLGESVSYQQSWFVRPIVNPAHSVLSL